MWGEADGSEWSGVVGAIHLRGRLSFQYRKIGTGTVPLLLGSGTVKLVRS